MPIRASWLPGHRAKGEQDGNVELIRGERSAGLLTGQARAGAGAFLSVARQSLAGLGGTPANVKIGHACDRVVGPGSRWPQNFIRLRGVPVTKGGLCAHPWFASASRLGQNAFVGTDAERFNQLVADALDQIPESLGHVMENVGVYVEDWPTAQQMAGKKGVLLGLYQGVDLTRRSAVTYGATMPDRITIFRGPISRLAKDEADLVRIVTTTVVHEVAHHFGISDRRLEELGWA